MDDLPRLALSVRQPWARAIIYGGKIIENRSVGAIRAGRMTTGRICIHAASGMKEDEYRRAHWRLGRHGVSCPRPDDLVRSAIIGAVEVTDIVTASDSEWFGGSAGLILASPQPAGPIAASGALGYFEWQPGGSIAPARPWMKRFDLNQGDGHTLPLFPDAEPSYRAPPAKPVRKG